MKTHTQTTRTILVSDFCSSVQEAILDHLDNVSLPENQKDKLYGLIDDLMQELVADVASQLVDGIHFNANDALVDPTHMITYEVTMPSLDGSQFTWRKGKRFA